MRTRPLRNTIRSIEPIEREDWHTDPSRPAGVIALPSGDGLLAMAWFPLLTTLSSSLSP